MIKSFILCTIVIATTFLGAAQSQTKKVFTAADYERAVKFLGVSTNKQLFRSSVSPQWLEDGKFWYTVTTSAGPEFVLINPADGSRKVATDKKLLLPEGAEKASTANRGGSDGVVSPDGKKAVFIRDWNLWIRETDSKKETQITRDGLKDYGYATDN
ncbi:MAG: DPP IV N-terminal domain-containing protein, partial [Ferruginibacter sp.]